MKREMNKSISNSEQFVQGVMTALPRRESALQRIGRLLLSFVLSPLWIWSGFAVLVIVFHEPLIRLLFSLTESRAMNSLILVTSAMVAVAFITRQMLHDLKKYRSSLV